MSYKPSAHIQDLLTQNAGYMDDELLQILEESGVDFQRTTESGSTALMSAAESGNMVLLKNLIKKGSDIHAKDARGWTALHYAACAGHERLLHALLKKGAQVDILTLRGESAASIARIHSHHTLADELDALLSAKEEDQLQKALPKTRRRKQDASKFL